MKIETNSELEFTQNWWRRCLVDKNKMTSWLQKLQLTEIGGYRDYLEFIQRWPDMPERTRAIFHNIGTDERKHSDILLELFDSEGIKPEVASLETMSMYWAEVNSHITDLETCCAVNYYGENLASFRFSVIRQMPETPGIIKNVIDLILPDEQFHTITLKKLAGDGALRKIAMVHQNAKSKLKGM